MDRDDDTKNDKEVEKPEAIITDIVNQMVDTCKKLNPEYTPIIYDICKKKQNRRYS